uniref:Uncharacterized protein n=1 Tax=Octopus bimaculoides TaxID=37653 RepID=A0A0L8GHI7_OCTBM
MKTMVAKIRRFLGCVYVRGKVLLLNRLQVHDRYSIYGPSERMRCPVHIGQNLNEAI